MTSEPTRHLPAPIWPAPERPHLELVRDQPHQLPLPIFSHGGPGSVPGNKGRRFPPEIYSPLEMYRLLEACNWKRSTGIRNAALIVLMYRAGLRHSEALHIRLGDLNEAESTIRIMHGKGGTTRTVGIDRTGMRLVQQWVTIRRELDLPFGSPVFSSKAGKPLTPSLLRMKLPALGEKALIEKRMHTHAFRHTFAFELVMEGVPLTMIQNALGHTYLSSTSKYLAHLAPGDVIERVRSRTWGVPATALFESI